GEPEVLGLLLFHPDIAGGGGIRSHEDRAEARSVAGGDEGVDSGGEVGENGVGDRPPRKHPCGHGSPLTTAAGPGTAGTPRRAWLLGPSRRRCPRFRPLRERGR